MKLTAARLAALRVVDHCDRTAEYINVELLDVWALANAGLVRCANNVLGYALTTDGANCLKEHE